MASSANFFGTRASEEHTSPSRARVMLRGDGIFVLRCVCTYIINAPAGRECILDGVCIIASEVALFLLKLKMQFDTVSGEDDIAMVRRGLLS